MQDHWKSDKQTNDFRILFYNITKGLMTHINLQSRHNGDDHTFSPSDTHYAPYPKCLSNILPELYNRHRILVS